MRRGSQLPRPKWRGLLKDLRNKARKGKKNDSIFEKGDAGTGAAYAAVLSLPRMRMKKFTINDIRKWKPYYKPGRYLPKSWEGTALDILNNDRISLYDRFWTILRTDLVSERLMRQFALWCAQQVKHRITSKKILHALDVVEAFVEHSYLMENDEEFTTFWRTQLADAEKAAWSFSRLSDASWAAAATVLQDPGAAARTAALGAAWSASRNLTSNSALEKAKAAQEQKLREMLIAGIETGDTK